MPRETITVEELAQRYHITEYTARRWCRDGIVKAEKVGRRWIVHLKKENGK
ncbi:gp046 [Rhodococcus phage ReqiDocB7]|uniref:gp046 n=1 Tax=Rhodococcus phage ReqiDocB7 TaxID=691966 RepID=UPI0001CDD770|nr:gp046 [Rhodococcus phage ReqiDocB7]ADD80832.1 gp046 [Rhodococcus phage ReqiDocB7]